MKSLDQNKQRTEHNARKPLRRRSLIAGRGTNPVFLHFILYSARLKQNEKKGEERKPLDWLEKGRSIA